jgi:outer membrane protein insertion porin family
MSQPAQRAPLRLAAALAAALCLGAPLLAQPAPDPQPGVIRQIDIEAPPKADIGRIRDTIRTREGDRYAPAAVEADITELYRLGDYRNIRVRHEPVPGGVRLVYHIELRPRISAIRLEGEYGVQEDTLLGLMQCKVGAPASPPLLKVDLEALRLHYREEGFLYADLKQEILPVEDGVDVLYRIEAGPHVAVEDLRFEGFADVPLDEVRKIMISVKESGLFGRGRFDPTLLRSDILAIRELLRRRGYLNATVGYEMLFDDARERLHAVVRAGLGKLYRVKTIAFEGAEVIAEEELRKTLRLRDGDPYSQEVLDKDLEALRALYGRRGYVKAQATATHRYDPDEPLVLLSLRIAEGPLTYVHRVLVRGNHVTRDRVIRRDVSLLPGDIANTAELEETKRRLLNTGLFASSDKSVGDDGVNVRLVDTDQPDRSDVVVDVMEHGRGEFGIGASYHSEFGLMGNLRFTLRNFDALAWPRSWREMWSPYAFSGGGQTLNVSLTPGYDYQDYRLSWFNPSVWDTPYSTGFDLYARQTNWPDYYDERRVGGSFTVGRSFFHDLGVSLTPRIERVKISNVDDSAPQEAKDSAGDYLRASLALNAVYDRRDNRFFTTDGYRVEAGVEMAGTALGGDINLVKETLEARRWWTVFEPEGWGKHIFSVGSRLGFLQRTRGDVPIFERFFMGGLDSLRGFAVHRAGPVDPASGRQTGGDSLFLGSVEYEIPIVRDYVRGVAFIDSGALADNGFQFSSLRMSAGGGFRLRIPVMGMQRVPVCFYIATPIRSQTGDQSETVSFTVGTMFGF